MCAMRVFVLVIVSSKANLLRCIVCDSKQISKELKSACHNEQNIVHIANKISSFLYSYL